MNRHDDLTPDLCDQFEGALSVLDPGFASFGGHDCFHGEVVTIAAFEDNSLVRQWVAEPGDGRVLVVDGGGSLRRAMLGDQLAQKAVDNGWEAIVINGCIRDAVQIEAMPIAVYALNTHPMKTEKLGAGQSQVPLRFAGVAIDPGHYMAGDINGLVVSSTPLLKR